MDLNKPVYLKDLCLILAKPTGPCPRPPAPRRVRGWVEAGMPYQIKPLGKRKEFIPAKCIAWLAKKGVVGGEETV